MIIQCCKLGIFLFLLIACRGGWGYHYTHSSWHDDNVIVSQDERIVAFAKKKLPLEGTLKEDRNGYVYLKVTNAYVYELFPLLKAPGFTMPSAIRRHTKIGAHISVFYSHELRSIGPIEEIGNVYSFVPKHIERLRAGAKEFLILQVDAPSLEQLRKRYGLSPKLLGHDFHITLAERFID